MTGRQNWKTRCNKRIMYYHANFVIRRGYYFRSEYRDAHQLIALAMFQKKGLFSSNAFVIASTTEGRRLEEGRRNASLSDSQLTRMYANARHADWMQAGETVVMLPCTFPTTFKCRAYAHLFTPEPCPCVARCLDHHHCSA